MYLVDRYHVGGPPKLLELEAGVQGVQARLHPGRGYTRVGLVLARNASPAPVLEETARPCEAEAFALMPYDA